MFNLRLIIVAFLLTGASLVPASAAVIGPHYHITGRIAAPNFRWDLLSVDSSTRRLYIGNGGGVSTVNLDTGKMTPELLSANRIHRAVAITKSGIVAATSGAKNALILFRADTGKVIAEIPTGKEPDTVLREPVSGNLLTFNQDSNDATIIDFDKKMAIGSIPLGGSPEFAVAGNDGMVYDNISDTADIAVIDVPARKIVRRYALEGCVKPTGLAFDARSGLLVSACSNGVVMVLDAKSGKAVTALTVGKGPDAVILDSKRRLAFIPSAVSGTLSIIALNTPGLPAVVQVLKTKRGTRTGAVDEKTGRLYLPAADFLPVKKGEFPDIVPGTVQILIISP